jgi:Metallopeptidase family M24
MPTSFLPQPSEREIKRQRVRDILDQVGAEAVSLTSTAAVSWYLDGARVHVNLAGPPILSVRVSHERDQVFVTSNELARLVREELPADVELHVRQWHEDANPADCLDESAIERELRDARRSLLPNEIVRYRSLGFDTASALTQVLSQSNPLMTELDLAASLAKAIIERGADPIVLLAAGAARLSNRHPLPTSEYLGRRAMLVVCARRRGLIASATRWVTFGRATPAERDAENRIGLVEAAMLDATTPGAELREVLAAAQRAYVDNGFLEDEWLGHHQGGATGYATRDPRATPTARDTVAISQPFAWNPTAPGAKCEDTVLVAADGIELLTADERWPTSVVEGRTRPVALEL